MTDAAETRADKEVPRRPWVTRTEAAATLLLAVIFLLCVVVIAVRNHRAGAGTRILSANEARYVLDVNHAEAAELMLLPGIGRVRADKIVAWRHEHGPFASFDQVCAAAGMSQAEFQKLAPSITLGKQ